MARRPVTAWQTVGPFFDRKLIRAGEGHDLTLGGPAGEVVELAGRVLQGDGAGVPGSLIELWQANAAGRYAHPGDRAGDRPLDPGFKGFGRTLTDRDGAYRFRTIRPGAVPYEGNRWQAPHLVLSVFAAGLLRRLVTRAYFADEAANADDPVLAGIADPAARATLIAARETAGPPPRYRFDIVLQGEHETAFFID